MLFSLFSLALPAGISMYDTNGRVRVPWSVACVVLSLTPIYAKFFPASDHSIVWNLSVKKSDPQPQDMRNLFKNTRIFHNSNRNTIRMPNKRKRKRKINQLNISTSSKGFLHC